MAISVYDGLTGLIQLYWRFRDILWHTWIYAAFSIWGGGGLSRSAASGLAQLESAKSRGWRGFVGGVGQILACVAWVAWVHKILAWVTWVAWVHKILAWVAWVEILAWVAWLAWVKKAGWVNVLLFNHSLQKTLRLL